VLRRQRKRRIDRDFILETIVIRLPQENYERVFETLVGWATFGNLFVYDEAKNTVALAGAEQHQSSTYAPTSKT
jgi:hypothetical protein